MLDNQPFKNVGFRGVTNEGSVQKTLGVFSPDILVTVSEMMDMFPHLEGQTRKHSLNLFTVLSLPMIQSLDRELTSSQDLLSEGVQFLELVTQLSVFYTTPSAVSYVDEVVDRLCGIRHTGVKSTDCMSLSSEAMEEYFVSSQENLRATLKANPFLLGLYLYVLVKSIVRYKVK
jgi:hypothetical protein